MSKQHIPILVQEIIDHIPDHATHIVDGTFGHGGHTMKFAQHLHEQGGGKITVSDRDHDVLQRGRQLVTSYMTEHEIDIPIDYILDSYASLSSHVPAQSIDYILLDLGINREHVTDNTRGFSFQGDGPLDMRFDTTSGITAYELLLSSSLDKMINWFMIYGDFSPKRAHLIAQLITQHTSDDRLHTTLGFVDILREIKIHRKELAPLFQCIRIAVNQEFDHVDRFIAQLNTILAPGGRCAIISFHSIEDRIIKNHFKTLAEDGSYHIINKHVIKPHRTEVKRNKASRSAKLRIIEKHGGTIGEDGGTIGEYKNKQ